MWYLTIIFLVIAAICKAVKDTVEFHYSTSVFSKLNCQYWYPQLSWANKYKSAQDLRPRFWGSTTVFVMFTDAWHLFDFLQIISFVFAIIFYSKMIYFVADFVIFYILFCGVFELFYSLIFKQVRE